MSSDNSNSVNLGGGGVFLSLLAVLFIGLKLTGHIDWPWIWVLAPLWIPIAIFLVVLLVVVLLVFVFNVNWKTKRRSK